MSARRRFPTVRPFAPKGRHAGNPHAHLPTPLHDRQRAPLARPRIGRAATAAWPARPLRLVVTFPPGGASDIAARLIAPALAERLGQPVVIENKPGAGSTIGAALVAQAPADGYTLLMSNSAPLSISPALMPGHGYDALASFDHLAYIGAVPTAFVIHPSVPVATLAELTAWIKAQDQPVQFGSGGRPRSARSSANSMRAPPARAAAHSVQGSGAMRNDLLGGQIRFAVDALPQNLPICAPASCGCWPSEFPPWANSAGGREFHRPPARRACPTRCASGCTPS